MSATLLSAVLAATLGAAESALGSEQDSLKSLAVDYLDAVVEQNHEWIAEHASDRSLAPYEELRLAALYAPEGDLLSDERRIGCYDLADSAIVLLLRSLATEDQLRSFGAREIYPLIAPHFTISLPRSQGWAERILRERAHLKASLEEVDAMIQGDLAFIVPKDGARVDYLSQFVDISAPMILFGLTDLFKSMPQEDSYEPNSLVYSAFSQRNSDGEWGINISQALFWEHRRDWYYRKSLPIEPGSSKKILATWLQQLDINLDDLFASRAPRPPGVPPPCPYQAFLRSLQD